jgi:Flp pilus assembly protein TadB
MRPDSPVRSRALIQVIVTVAIATTLVVIAETTQTLWLYYVVFAILTLSFLLSWLQARRDKQP